ncbi:MAG TPA: alpha/beta hydrolase [Candidatus Limnocylindrales bacterium]|nr:alpha/beta hydrolase [Candidatus Limnocylindrales bacterium]
MTPAVQFTTTRDGVRIAYSISGAATGRCVVCTPPLPFRHVELEWQLDEDRRFLERLGRRRRVLRYDPRGLGLSDRDGVPCSMDALAADLEAVLDAAAPGEAAALFACVNSVPVAVRYARLHPERVSHLILWCPVARMGDSIPPQVETLFDVAERDWELFTEAAAHVMVGWGRGDSAHRYAAYLRACVTPEGMRMLIGGTRDLDASADLPHLSVPTLVLHRRQLTTIAAAAVARISSLIPQARLVVLEGDVMRPGVGDIEAAARAVDAFLGDTAEEDLPSSAPSATAVPASAPLAYVFRREGEYWTLGFDGAITRVRDTKGMRHIARLMRERGRDIAAIDLVVEHEPEVARYGGDSGPILDARARQSYKGRLAELRASLDAAETAGDAAGAAAARAEIEALGEQLAAAVGLGGRERRAGSASERARLTVTKRIKDAIARIRASQPDLARHLSMSIHTGHLCAYRPERPIDWTF